jgi:hypothetical protein
MSYKTNAEYYFEVNGVEGEVELVLEFDYQRAERATRSEPGCGAGLTLCGVTMKDGTAIDPLVAGNVDDWAQNYLDEHTSYIVDKEIHREREYW